MPFSAVDARETIRFLELRTATDPFGYIVTPNVDHVVRNWRGDGQLAELYDEAELSLCDSRIVSLIGRICGVRLPVVTGSDLTAILLDYIVDPHERVTIIGGTTEVVTRLARRYGLKNIRHHNPPMGFIHDPIAVLEAAQFVEHNAARFVLFAVGSPQQEQLAFEIKRRGMASGIGLCVGASLLFLTGDLARAPEWMQRARLEWLHRLLQEPRRMWRRYLYDGPRILRIAGAHFSPQRAKPKPAVLVSIVVLASGRDELLPRLLERCALQGGLAAAALEILVVDQSPEGAARGVVERSAAHSSVAIRYLHEPRAGLARARNRGVAEGRGEFVAFVADGELPARVWLEALLRTYRVFGADIVMGPIRPLFEEARGPFQPTYRAFFTRTSKAPTGTSIEERKPWRARSARDGHLGLAVNNALLRRATCLAEPEPFDPNAGGGADELFLTRLQRSGKKLVWCREALLHERVAKEQLTPGSLLRERFRDGQNTSSTCLRLAPPDYRDLLGWLAIGVARIAAGSLGAVVLGPFARRRGLQGLCVAANGLGMLAFPARRRPGRPGPQLYAERMVPKAG
ncbi:MAG: WecB/TagA/CpsF family glycosyltransferase [Geminicoccaceae bacterium]